MTHRTCALSAISLGQPNASEAWQMSDYCTIVSPVNDLKNVITTLRQLGAEISHIDGTEQEWRSISLRSDVSELVFNSMIRQFPGDEFSKLVLGIHNLHGNYKVPT